MSSSNDDPEFDPTTIDRPRSSFEAGSASRSSTSNTAILSYTAGFPAWAVVLTVIPSLVLFCFIGYCIFVGYYDQEEKEFVFFSNHPSFDEPTNCSSDGSFCSSVTGTTSSSTGRTSRALYPVNICTTIKKTAQDPQKMTEMVLTEPNYENPDPEGETTTGAIAQALKNGEDKSKIRSVEPDTKPKIELEPEEAAIIKEAPGQKAGPSVSSFVKAQRVLYGKLVDVDTGTSDDDDDKDDNDSYEFESNLPHTYAPTPTRKNKMSELKGSFVSVATKGPNEEENTRAQMSGKKEKLTKRDSSSSSSSNWRKGKKEFRRLSSMTLTSLQERERSKLHRNYSGVESRSGSVGSIELESNASSVERYAEHLQRQSEEVKGSLVGSLVSFAIEGPNEEEKTRAQKSRKTQKSRKKKQQKRDCSSDSRKGNKESRRSRRSSSFTLTSFEERERSKEHRNYSGVESCSGSIGSIEHESKAPSVEERYAEHLQRQAEAEELKGSLVSGAMTAAAVAVAAVTRGKESDEAIAIEQESNASSVEEHYSEHLQRQAEELKGSLVSAATTAAAVAAVTRGNETKRIGVEALAGSDESIGISELESKAPSVGRQVC